MLLYGLKETEIKTTNTQIQIEGMYGLEIDFANIEKITLLEKNMEEIGIGTRTNGFGGVGNKLKGNFKSQSLGKHILHVNSTSSPTILIEQSNGADVYISFKDSEKTKEIFQKIEKETASS